MEAFGLNFDVPDMADYCLSGLVMVPGIYCTSPAGKACPAVHDCT